MILQKEEAKYPLLVRATVQSDAVTVGCHESDVYSHW
jgi:hypothetical protein